MGNIDFKSFKISTLSRKGHKSKKECKARNKEEGKAMEQTVKTKGTKVTNLNWKKREKLTRKRETQEASCPVKTKK